MIDTVKTVKKNCLYILSSVNIGVVNGKKG